MRFPSLKREDGLLFLAVGLPALLAGFLLAPMVFGKHDSKTTTSSTDRSTTSNYNAAQMLVPPVRIAAPAYTPAPMRTSSPPVIPAVAMQMPASAPVAQDAGYYVIGAIDTQLPAERREESMDSLTVEQAPSRSYKVQMAAPIEATPMPEVSPAEPSDGNNAQQPENSNQP
jgi:hypothetical protein